MSSIDLNPSAASIHLSPAGSDFLWAVFGVFTAATAFMVVLAHHRPIGHRGFHFLAAAILLISAVSYSYLASNLGFSPVPVEFLNPGGLGQYQASEGEELITRSVSYTRFVAWALTWPMLLLMLQLATALPLSTIFFDLFISETSVVCLLIGALVPNRYKWVSYSFGAACLLYDSWALLILSRREAYVLGVEYGQAFSRSALLLVGCWLVYPVIWGVSEGANLITVTAECIAYGVLDLLTRLVFPFYFLFNYRRLDYDRFQFVSGKISIGTPPPSTPTRYAPPSIPYPGLGAQPQPPPSLVQVPTAMSFPDSSVAAPRAKGGMGGKKSTAGASSGGSAV
ncbi:hypothetical protein JCM6882_009083 [Rhodosporidiobolus microsporus]